ncbi:MAG TPA: hypothetical protein ENH41_04890 [Candidatus Omnitrophica bacterium]|nr:hypothetical protein [Candidatus Omnitrophota bacterium]
MNPRYHVAVSFAISSTVYVFLNSLSAAMASFLAGVFIDLDHYLDFVLQYRSLNIKKFFGVFMPYPLIAKSYLFLHSFELLIVFWFIVYKFGLGLFWMGLVIGMTQHLIFDQLHNKYIRPYFYFITTRYLSGFKKERLFRAPNLGC